MYKPLLIILSCSFIYSVNNCYAQVSGCTDPQSNNYNPSATINDGSCTYNATSLTLTEKTPLSTPLLDETSGLEFLDGKLWTFNDSGNPNDIYRVDTSSNTVFQTVDISNSTNVDWEDMTSNNNYLFVGDFGNNNGNRQNLKIYRIDKNNLTPGATSVTADIINFSYSDQTSFPSLPNNNNYDCESMIFFNDSIHLFSKDWVDKQSRHYVLPNTPGTHVAQYRETLNAGFLVTSATIQDFGVIALLGYDNSASRPIYMYMLYDYKNNLFFNGNKRKFDISTELVYGQTEGVEFLKGAYGYISNERFTSGATVAPKLRTFNLASYLPAAYLYAKPDANFTENNTSICINAFINFTDQSINTPASWQWSFPGGTPATSTLQNPQIQYMTAGTYSVTLVAGNGAGYDTIVKTNYITVNALPTATAGGSNTVCQSASPAAITLSGASVGGSATTGAWSVTSGGGTLSTLLQTATPETVTYTPATNFSGTVTLLLTSNAGIGCSAATAIRTITINALPTATAGGPNSVCKSATPAAIILSGASVGGSATTGAWSITSGGGTLSSLLQTATPATVTYTPAANFSGTVTLLLTSDAGTGCSAATATRTITVNTLPPANITAGGPLNFCTGESVLLSANSGTGLTYQWKKGVNILSGATSSTYTVTGTGNYKVIVTNQTGCTRTSNTLSVTGPPSVAITTTGSLDLCPGDSVTFQVPFVSGNLYQWKKNNVNISGATLNSYSAYTAGKYKVTVTNTFGCSKLSGVKTVTTNCRFEDDALVSQYKIKVYPNPSADYFNISLTKDISYEIIIYDLSGKKIEKHFITNVENFTIGENLQPGFYLCEIICENKRELFKIVKAGE
ncbi:MAG TPA: PKD domain-containing protein [Bacteroidia bacterium]|nr:PKD domain-containing protein [Bacteroidia bacterium]